jgi:predicted nucleotidyltransferase
MGQRILMDDNGILEEVLRRLQVRFGHKVVSVVLYGSQARAEAESGSDVDLLVVVPDLPQEWRDLFSIEDELAQMGIELGRPMDIRLVEPEGVAHAVTSATPLMLEIYDSHRLVFDPDGFFSAELRRLTAVMHERGISKLSRGVWRVPSVAEQ